MSQHLLAIDQGTTSSRVIIFDQSGGLIAKHQIEFKQYFPKSGWVEHDAQEIWQGVVTCFHKALEKAKLTAKDITAIGITNQRETTLIWDKKTGKPIANAIVWQDRRTSDFCKQLKQQGYEKSIRSKTGLLLDPYFSASKVNWLLDHIPSARNKAENNELAFGTIDSFLLWHLTHGKSHATDASNASRTLLFNITTQQWDDELIELFNIPKPMLPQVLDNCTDFGVTDPKLFGEAIPITAMVGDQQAALIGQACFAPGMLKSTYGTGCFLMLNTGSQCIQSKKLLSTIAYRIKGKTIYALEGSIFSAGASVKWLRDKLQLIQDAKDTQTLASSLSDNGGVYLVPAFTGLGAPYWQPDVRAAIFGLTRDTSKAHLVRAALEAVAYQTNDLLAAMQADSQAHIKTLRADGGMIANDWLAQFLADIIQLPVSRPHVTETTASGAAYLAGLGANCYQSLDEISTLWKVKQRFHPKLAAKKQAALYNGWQNALKCLLS